MKRILLLLPLLALVGCCPVTKSSVSSMAELADGYGSTRIVTIRRCEYVCYVTAGGYGAGVCHAGDCSNPIHLPCAGDTLQKP